MSSSWEELRASMQKARMEIPQQMPIPQQQASAPVAPTPVQQPIPPQVVYVRRNFNSSWNFGYACLILCIGYRGTVCWWQAPRNFYLESKFEWSNGRL